MMPPKITAVTPLDHYVLHVSFADGSQTLYDVTPLLTREPFTALKNAAFFRHVSIEPGGYAVSWNSEIDISEFDLWCNGQPIPSS